jgi:hypothetical protein
MDELWLSQVKINVFELLCYHSPRLPVTFRQINKLPRRHNLINLDAIIHRLFL